MSALLPSLALALAFALGAQSNDGPAAVDWDAIAAGGDACREAQQIELQRMRDLWQCEELALSQARRALLAARTGPAAVKRQPPAPPKGAARKVRDDPSAADRFSWKEGEIEIIHKGSGGPLISPEEMARILRENGPPRRMKPAPKPRRRSPPETDPGI
jgi:hypothetical protein